MLWSRNALAGRGVRKVQEQCEWCSPPITPAATCMLYVCMAAVSAKYYYVYLFTDTGTDTPIETYSIKHRVPVLCSCGQACAAASSCVLLDFSACGSSTTSILGVRCLVEYLRVATVDGSCHREAAVLC